MRSLALALWMAASTFPLGALAQGDLAPEALVQEDVAERARAHFEQGSRAFDEGDYERSVEEFRAAHALVDHPDLLYNVYTAAERAGRLEEAESSLAAYLAEAELEPERRPALEARLARLRSRLEALRAEAMDSESAASEPNEVAPAGHASPAQGEGVHPAGVAVLVGAGALFASFATFAILSAVEDAALAGRCGRDAPGTCSDAEVASLATYNLLADASWIAGLALTAVGVALLLALDPEPGEVAVLPWATPLAAGVATRGSF